MAFEHDSIHASLSVGTMTPFALFTLCACCVVRYLTLRHCSPGAHPGRNLWNRDAEQVTEKPRHQERADRADDLCI